MKKLSLIALAAFVGIGLSSCLKDVTPVDQRDAAPAKLTIRLNGAADEVTRSVEAAGSNAVGTIQLLTGHIFVLNQANEVVYSEVLDVNKAWTGQTEPAEGQVLDTEVPGNARVYILGNVPAADQTALTGLQNFDEIAAYVSSIATQIDYQKVALANFDFSPKAIEPDGSVGDQDPVDGQTTVNVTIAPLVSRLELHKVTGDADITSFTVTGVYVDDWFPNFNYIGEGKGLPFSQGKSTNFSPNAKNDEGTWAAVAKVATAGTDKVWAHQVASGNIPRFIIRVQNVVATAPGPDGVAINPTETYYLTVLKYANLDTPVFAPGVIYRIGATGNGLEFGPDNLTTVPNPENVAITGLTVTVQEWKLSDIEPEL